MTIPPFRRPANWSSAFTIQRIEATSRSLRKRLDKTVAETALLQKVEMELRAALLQLEDVKSREVEVMRRRAESRGKPAQHRGKTRDGTPLSGHDSSQEGTAVHITVHSFESAGASDEGQPSDYDRDLYLYRTPDGLVGGSTHPHPATPSSGEVSPLLDRALMILNTPGLIHYMVGAETSQIDVDVDVLGLPERSSGIGLSDAYADHTLSGEVLQVLANEDAAEKAALMTKLLAD